MDKLNRIIKEHIKIIHYLYNDDNQLTCVCIQINLSDCNLTNDDLKYICKSLLNLYQMSNITLKAKLDLSYNVFNDIEPLKELLQVNFIESLDLTNIYFDTKQLL